MTEPTRPDSEPDAAAPPGPAPEPPETGEEAAAQAAEPGAPTSTDVPSVAEDGVAPVAVEPVEADPTTRAGAATPAATPGRPAAAVVLGYLGVAVLGIVIGAGALAVGTDRLGASSPAPSPTPAPSAAPAGNAIGSVDAPVTIEVWADYQCPYCRLEDLLFGGALEREYVMPGVARIVYRDFAFLGQESTDAAVAARCAGAQEVAAQLRYHDALYTFQQGENQGRFVRDNLVQIAEIAGVPDKAAFEACLDDPAIAKAVADETVAGRAAGVSSTPTMLLRGPGGERVLTGFSQTWPPLRDAIEAVLAASTPTPSSGAATPAPSSSPAPSTSPVPSAAVPPSPSPAASASASAAPTPAGAPSPVAPTPAPSASPAPGSSTAASPSPRVTPAP